MISSNKYTISAISLTKRKCKFESRKSKNISKQINLDQNQN